VGTAEGLSSVGSAVGVIAEAGVGDGVAGVALAVGLDAAGVVIVATEVTAGVTVAEGAASSALFGPHAITSTARGARRRIASLSRRSGLTH